MASVSGEMLAAPTKPFQSAAALPAEQFQEALMQISLLKGHLAREY